MTRCILLKSLHVGPGGSVHPLDSDHYHRPRRSTVRLHSVRGSSSSSSYGERRFRFQSGAKLSGPAHLCHLHPCHLVETSERRGALHRVRIPVNVNGPRLFRVHSGASSLVYSRASFDSSGSSPTAFLRVHSPTWINVQQRSSFTISTSPFFSSFSRVSWRLPSVCSLGPFRINA